MVREPSSVLTRRPCIHFEVGRVNAEGKQNHSVLRNTRLSHPGVYLPYLRLVVDVRNPRDPKITAKCPLDGYGDGVAVSARDGQSAHDELFPDGDGGVRRETNRAGGLEGGVTNGEPVRVRAYIKPISTQRKGLRSVDLKTGKPRRGS